MASSQHQAAASGHASCAAAAAAGDVSPAAAAAAAPPASPPTPSAPSAPSASAAGSQAAAGPAAAAAAARHPAAAASSLHKSGAAADAAQPSVEEVMRHATRKALGGGVPGMAAMAVQVVSLMWLRTAVNYQYAHGVGMRQSFSELWSQGGARRFYRGLGPALLQAPLSRFGDTAANAGALSIFNSFESTQSLPLAVKTLAGSAAAGCWRALLMPLDSLKTMMQVQGKQGVAVLRAKVAASGFGVLYHGATAAAATTLVAHFPWWITYNSLNEWLPVPPASAPVRSGLLRSAALGFCSSLVSDCVSNSVRVIKTAKQTSPVAVTYGHVVKGIIDKDGVLGLMGRGLATKIIANGVQSCCFTILWRMGQEWWGRHVEGRQEQRRQQQQRVQQ